MDDRESFLAAAQTTTDLVRRPEVAGGRASGRGATSRPSAGRDALVERVDQRAPRSVSGV